ncbi:MAG: DnaA/Hda family protein [Alphaproteobacteria bacterium]|nr:DnaA/Hda family protein [Alphaproteobacteria bacterium]
MWQSLWQNQSDALWFSGKSMDYDSPYDLIDESTKAVILDDADCIKDEEWLFHFYNALNERQISFLMTGRTPPTHWSVSLPDLKSRLATVSSIELKQPDEETLWAVFQKQLTEKGIRVSEIVIDFILNRIERSFADVTHWVTLLDQHSAQTKRPVTVALVKDLLGE